MMLCNPEEWNGNLQWHRDVKVERLKKRDDYIEDDLETDLMETYKRSSILQVKLPRLFLES